MIRIYNQCNVSLNSGDCYGNWMCLSQPGTTCINGRCIPLGNMNLSNNSKNIKILIIMQGIELVDDILCL